MIELKLCGVESKVVMIMSLEAEGRKKMEVVGWIHRSQIIEFHLTYFSLRGHIFLCHES